MATAGAQDSGLRLAAGLAKSGDAAPRVTLELQRLPEPADESTAVARAPDPLPSRAALAVGTPIQICVTSAQRGYISLWSVDSDQLQVRIFPNKYAYPGELAAPIGPGERLCLGDGTQFTLSIAAPLGESKIYAHWTQLKEDARPDKPQEMITRGPARGFAEAWFPYLVVAGKG
jgi:hypothetical protein